MTEPPRATSGFLIDSNVLIDIATRDPQWMEWSTQAVATAVRSGPVVINAIIYSEVSLIFDSIADLDAVLPPAHFRRDPIPFSAAFLAGKAFAAYRRNGGERQSPMPDFYIGAHAVVQNLSLVTRDAGRYRSYFPTLRLITPDE